MCVQFSENLARGQIDFGKFVAVDGKDPQGLVAESQQLCFEGLTHGQRYEVAIRAGLPSDVNEELQKPVTLAVYVPDRKPFVRFTGKSYVLPSRGQQGIPIVTVNTDKVAVEVYRTGDGLVYKRAFTWAEVTGAAKIAPLPAAAKPAAKQP